MNESGERYDDIGLMGFHFSSTMKSLKSFKLRDDEYCLKTPSLTL